MFNISFSKMQSESKNSKGCGKSESHVDNRNNKNHVKGPNGTNMKKFSKELANQKDNRSIEVQKTKRNIEAYFLGTKGENGDYFANLIKKAIDSHLMCRQQFQMEDHRHITRKMKT